LIAIPVICDVDHRLFSHKKRLRPEGLDVLLAIEEIV
jgi:hypothetical protein